jgi:hypothetical protein
MAPVTAQDAARLGAEIESERRHLDHTVAEIQSRSSATDDTTIYALALLLMNYYTGAEKIFQRIAALLGGIPPAGDRWHAQLLEDMALDIPAVRPAVLRKETADALSGLLASATRSGTYTLGTSGARTWACTLRPSPTCTSGSARTSMRSDRFWADSPPSDQSSIRSKHRALLDTLAW